MADRSEWRVVPDHPVGDLRTGEDVAIHTCSAEGIHGIARPLSVLVHAEQVNGYGFWSAHSASRTDADDGPACGHHALENGAGGELLSGAFTDRFGRSQSSGRTVSSLAMITPA